MWYYPGNDTMTHREPTTRNTLVSNVVMLGVLFLVFIVIIVIFWILQLGIAEILLPGRQTIVNNPEVYVQIFFPSFLSSCDEGDIRVIAKNKSSRNLNLIVSFDTDSSLFFFESQEGGNEDVLQFSALAAYRTVTKQNKIVLHSTALPAVVPISVTTSYSPTMEITSITTNLFMTTNVITITSPFPVVLLRHHLRGWRRTWASFAQTSLPAQAIAALLAVVAARFQVGERPVKPSIRKERIPMVKTLPFKSLPQH